MLSVINRALKRSGLSIVRSRSRYPVDLTQVTGNPLEARYRAGKKSFLIHADPALCRNLWFFPCGQGAGNPFTETIVEYLDGKHTVYEGSVLHRFYESFQPASVAGIFGFGKPVHRDLERLPAHALVFPWDRGNMARRLKFRKDFALKENRNRGLFTEQQSLQVFDTVFDGMEPAA